MAAIVVTNPLGASDPVQVLYAYAVPGLYTQSGLGCEIGLVNNESLAGLITLKCQKNSASPGDFISVFGTRFGLAGVSLSDGEALPQGAEGGIISGSGRI